MQWRENSIILSSKLFSENSRIITILNKTLGKISGWVHGIKTPIQQGDISDILWRGRTSDQLGTFKIENIFSPFSYAFNDSYGQHEKNLSSSSVFAIESACTLCVNGMPEKAPHPELFESLKRLFLSIPQKTWLADYALFELRFLSEVGIGLDLSKCAVTGKQDGLFYVSPRTGCAVTKESGEKYKDRLFTLPQFLISHVDYVTSYDVFCALKMTGHFLRMYFCGINSKQLPLSRNYLVEALREKFEV